MALAQRAIVKIVVVAMVSIAIVGAAWLAIDQLHGRRMNARMNARVQEIIAMLDLRATPDFHDRLDKVRTFINDHSIHKLDGAFWRNQGNPAAFADGLLAHVKGLAAEPVHMECSTRTNLMQLILQALGYETRIVALFDSNTNLSSHSFLDIMNPKTKRWETQDADYDIYWRSLSSGKRISLADSAESIDDIEPCGRNDCGWDHESQEGIRAKRLIDYLDIISITAKQKAFRYTLYTSRADLKRIYSEAGRQGTFCEIESKLCKHGFYQITKSPLYAAEAPE
jgi:hypothetical protein